MVNIIHSFNKYLGAYYMPGTAHQEAVWPAHLCYLTWITQLVSVEAGIIFVLRNCLPWEPTL